MASTLTTVQNLVTDYLAARDDFNGHGGTAFMKDRQTLRTAYCNATVSPVDLSTWVSSLEEPERGEVTRRFAEWDLKIHKGSLTKTDPAQLSSEDFIRKADTLYRQYEGLLKSPLFTGLTKTKTDLRNALLPELKVSTAENVAGKYGITDAELKARMQHE